MPLVILHLDVDLPTFGSNNYSSADIAQIFQILQFVHRQSVIAKCWKVLSKKKWVRMKNCLQKMDIDVTIGCFFKPNFLYFMFNNIFSSLCRHSIWEENWWILVNLIKKCEKLFASPTLSIWLCNFASFHNFCPCAKRHLLEYM